MSHDPRPLHQSPSALRRRLDGRKLQRRWYRGAAIEARKIGLFWTWWVLDGDGKILVTAGSRAYYNHRAAIKDAKACVERMK